MEENIKFKKGDKVRYKTNPSEVYTVDMVCDDHYTLDVEGECVILPFTNQDLWELADIIEDLGITREDYTKAINECIFGEEEPASKDLEEEIKKMQRHYKTIEEYDGQYAPLYASDIEHIARHFAGWQKVKDQFQIDMAHDGGYMEGQDYAREQMMKDVVEAEYWDGSLFKNELRERFKDGDMVKLIIVKEE